MFGESMMSFPPLAYEVKGLAAAKPVAYISNIIYVLERHFRQRFCDRYGGIVHGNANSR